MNKKVTLGELLGARIVLAICIAVYYWCWARNGWEDYFSSIQQCVAIFAFMFFLPFSCAREEIQERDCGRNGSCKSEKVRFYLLQDQHGIYRLHRVRIGNFKVYDILGNNRIYADGRTGADGHCQNGYILLHGCKRNLRWRS